MKHSFTKTLLMTGLSALLGSLTLTAQTNNLTADVPFAFHAAGQLMPAGNYQLREGAMSNGVFEISNRDAHVARLVNAAIPKHYMPRESKLTFARSGNDYVLIEIAVAGTVNTNGLAPSAIKKNTPRNMGFSSMISVPLHVQ